jgi:2,4-dienoyl-CoA reductase-like NADH-dependent reductase (Old Yellow Enzyme family)
MCEYSAEEGKAAEWHMIYLGYLALSGAGLMILEASARAYAEHFARTLDSLAWPGNLAELSRSLSACPMSALDQNRRVGLHSRLSN